MKTPFFFLLILSATSLVAQSNLSIFNNNGQQFYVVLNGIRQNSKPETNVQVGQIKNGSYAVKIIFADGKTPDIDKNFMIDAPYDITTRVVFKKGQGKLQLMSMEPTQGAIQEAVVYRPTDAAVYSDAVVVNTIPSPNTTAIQTNISTNTNTNNNNTVNGTVNPSGSSNVNVQSTGVNTNAAGLNMNMNVQETTTNTTVTNTDPNDNVNLNMNLSVGGVNVNLNANASGTGVGTTATSVTPNIQVSSNANQTQSQAQVQTQVPAQTQGHTVNCAQTMNRLEAFKAELQDQSFEDDRLEALKLGLNKTCLTTAQAAQLLDLFSFDENRLEAAKYLSDRLTDRASAGELAKKLTFDSSKMEYRRYISE
jgi:hypothetical protein